MFDSTQEIMLITIQFLYAFGGLILIGALLFHILRNQALINEKKLRLAGEFEVELATQLQSQDLNEGTTIVAPTLKETDSLQPRIRTSNVDHIDGPLPDDIRVLKIGQGLNHNVNQHRDRLPRSKRYRKAASLAVRGITTDEIKKKVGLPGSEIDLIAKLYAQPLSSQSQRQLLVMESIEAG